MSILDVLIFDLYRESFIIKISIYSSSNFWYKAYVYLCHLANEQKEKYFLLLYSQRVT